jgi:hypothetical protein
MVLFEPEIIFHLYWSDECPLTFMTFYLSYPCLDANSTTHLHGEYLLEHQQR